MKRLLAVLACSLLPGALQAQSATSAQAEAAYQAKDYAACAKLYDQLSAAEAEHDAGYNSACCYALQGDKMAAFARLGKAVDKDSVSPRMLEGDADLASLRTDKRWPGLIARAQAAEDRRLAGVDRPLREQLLQRAQKDQAARQAMIDSKYSDQTRQETAAIDRDNTAWLKQVVAEKGWPGVSMAGKDGAEAAWLLVQHADADAAFQAQVLTLMEAAVARHDASPDQFALLTDRVLLAQGKPQRYGTQFHTGDDGSVTMQPTEDLDGLDARRSAVGLPPIAEYKRMLEQIYHRPVQ
ncbi:MAG: hypothetical protein QM601_11555 [Pseudoxanthomonas sp.]